MEQLSPKNRPPMKIMFIVQWWYMMILSIMYQEALTLAMPSALFSTRTIRNFTCGCRDEPLLGLSACQHLTAKRDMNISGFKGFKQNHENIWEKQDFHNIHQYPRLLPNGYRKLWKHIEPLQYSPSRSSQILQKSLFQRRTRQMKPSLSLRLSQTSSPSFTLWKSTCTRPNGL